MKTKKDRRSDLQKEYDNSVLLLKTLSPDSDEYQVQLKSVERLHKLLMDEKDHENILSKDALATVLLGTIQVVAVLSYEHLHTITSKALNFVIKGRLR